MSTKAGDVLRILEMLHSVKGSRDVMSILEKTLHSVKGGRGCIEDTGEDVA